MNKFYSIDVDLNALSSCDEVSLNENEKNWINGVILSDTVTPSNTTIKLKFLGGAGHLESKNLDYQTMFGRTDLDTISAMLRYEWGTLRLPIIEGGGPSHMCGNTVVILHSGTWRIYLIGVNFPLFQAVVGRVEFPIASP
eukprot:scaffold712016_cov55-Attheya_sp.AAC.3